MNLREIGAVLEVSESRVCQIHGQALLRVRAQLQDWAAADQKPKSRRGADKATDKSAAKSSTLMSQQARAA